MRPHRINMLLIGILCLGIHGAGASEMDAKIETSFKNSYVYRTYLYQDSIRAISREGHFTLSGVVADESHKSLAEETAGGLPGVVEVVNQLTVADKNLNEKSDGWIALKIKTALLFHRSVSGLRTKVEVKDGVAILTGDAYSEAEKELASEYAKDVQGVLGVRNEMKIVQKPESTELRDSMDDASITAQVKVALISHHSTSAIRTSVHTEKGVVTLSGRAKDQAEKDLISKIVSDINGVDSVVNSMEIMEENKIKNN